MIGIDMGVTPADLASSADELFRVASRATRLLRESWDPRRGTPVFTEAGRYTTRGWTEWTQGFQFGIAVLAGEALGDEELLRHGGQATVRSMAPHLSHVGVHDHGFNNISTFGTLLRQVTEGSTEDPWKREFLELALKLSGAVQATRWTSLPGGLGYVYSFNGRHSLFADTIRSMRSLAAAHLLGHALMEEQDRKVSLLGRMLAHAETTARYNVYFGNGRDVYDVPGRVAHESVFNVDSGTYRCPSSQQGYSPFSTWTRGHAWVLLGVAEQLEFLEGVSDEELRSSGYFAHATMSDVRSRFLEVARTVADFYLSETPTDGVPYWDTGAPGLRFLGNYRERPAEPDNDYEPVDSSAAAIAAQGLLRLGAFLESGDPSSDAPAAGRRYRQAGLTVARTLFRRPYLSHEERHEGILLHSVYHRPAGWDYVPPGGKVPRGESSMWGDFHAVELALCVRRLADGRPMQRYFDLRRSGEGPR